MSQGELGGVLQRAKPGWSHQEVDRVKLKLSQVGVHSVGELAEALTGNLNVRLKREGLKTFSSDTLQELRQCLGVDASKQRAAVETALQEEAHREVLPSTPLVQTRVTAAPAEFAPVKSIEHSPELDAGQGDREDSFPPKVRYSSAPTPFKHAQPFNEFRVRSGPPLAKTPSQAAKWPALGFKASQPPGKAAQPRARVVESEQLTRAVGVPAGVVRPAALAPDVDEAIPDLASLLQELNTEEHEDLEKRSKLYNVSADELIEPSRLGRLLDQIEGLGKMPAEKLQAAYEELGYATESTLPRGKLVSLVREALISEVMNRSALCKVCRDKGHGVDQSNTTSELLQLLKDSTWEALGIPLRRFSDPDVARRVLLRVQELPTCGLQELEDQSRELGLPPPPKQSKPDAVIAHITRAVIWHNLPTPEIRREWRAYGMFVNTKDDGLPEKAEREQLLARLNKVASGNRPEAMGIPGDLLTDQAIQEVLQVVDRLQVMGPLSVRAEYKKPDYRKVNIRYEPNWDTQTLVDRLRDVTVWRRLNVRQLHIECKKRELPRENQVVDDPCVLIHRLLDWHDKLFEKGLQNGLVQRLVRHGLHSEASQLATKRAVLERQRMSEHLRWYRDIVQMDEDMEKSELVNLRFKLDVWNALPIAELRKECSMHRITLESSSSSFRSDSDETEQLVNELFFHECRIAWDKKGFRAFCLSTFEDALQVVREYQRYGNMHDTDLREAYKKAGLPHDESMEKQELLDILRSVLVWEFMPLERLREDCRHLDLSTEPLESSEAGELDRERARLFQELWVYKTRAYYERRGIPVKRLTAWQIVSIHEEFSRFEKMDKLELRAEYENIGIPSGHCEHKLTLLEHMRNLTIWMTFTNRELWRECKIRGMPMCGFDEKVIQDEPPDQQQLLSTAEENPSHREQLLVRLVLRARMAKPAEQEPVPAEHKAGNSDTEDSDEMPPLLDMAQTDLPGREPADAASPDPAKEPAAPEQEKPPSGAATSSERASTRKSKRSRSKWESEVWDKLRYMRDPVILECICRGVSKPLPKSLNLPPKARSWEPLEAVLHVLSHGVLDPDVHRRDIGEESGAAERRLVSVVCPTSERRAHFHPLLYECWEIQDYEPKELVVVDSGERPSSFFLEKSKEDPRVIYRHFKVQDLREGTKTEKTAWSLGLKRNIACYLARGEAIAHFDDDDLYASHYLSYCMPRLEEAAHPGGAIPGERLGPAAAKLSQWHLLDVLTMTWRYLDIETDKSIPPRSRRPWLYGWGFSYFFTRTAWELAPFPDTEFAEDIGFMEGLISKGVPVALIQMSSKGGGLVAHSHHASSTSGGEVFGFKRCGKEVLMPPTFNKLLDTVNHVHHQDPGLLPRQTLERFTVPKHKIFGKPSLAPARQQWAGMPGQQQARTSRSSMGSLGQHWPAMQGQPLGLNAKHHQLQHPAAGAGRGSVPGMPHQLQHPATGAGRGGVPGMPGWPNAKLNQPLQRKQQQLQQQQQQQQQLLQEQQQQQQGHRKHVSL